MESIIKELIAQYGLPGLILAFLAWQYFQNSKNIKASVSKDDIKQVQENIKTSVDGQISNIKSYIVSEREVLKELIDISGERIDNLKTHVDDRIANLSEKMDILEDQILDQPANFLETIQNREDELKKEHDQRFYKQLDAGSELFDVLTHYKESANFDHIFVGSFHNGTSSLSGVPYYKFDLIAEKFDPDHIERDVEFTHMYYNADLMKHGKLPITLIQNNKLHYTIDENGYSDLSKIDDIIYRRMRGRDIKQIALHLLRDNNGKPSGFVGGIRYNYDRIRMDQLSKCASELEKIF